MFKTVGEQLWAFDSEWVPDPAAGRLLYHLEPDTPDADVVAEMWRQGGATEEDPTPFLKTALCRVVSIAAVQRHAHRGKTDLKLLWLPRDTAETEQQAEAAIVGTFLNAVGRFRPQLIGFNSVNADLKILFQRAVIGGMSTPGFCKRPDKPWEGPDYFSRNSEANIDLMDILSSWGKGSVSLHEAATLSGIPGKIDAAGEQVAQLWLTGRWTEIVQYNCFDALTTYLLWLRMAHVGGFFNDQQYLEEQRLVQDLIEEEGTKPGGEYLEQYSDAWHRLREATGQPTL